MTHRHDRALRVGSLARVEGEGAMRVRVVNGTVEKVQLEIYEPPRFFEAFLRGRQHLEPPDITARVCGICPVAYQTSACLAIEDACAVRVPDDITDLRRLIYCGEWISSHALHIYLLHAPDFLGYPSVVELAQAHPVELNRGLSLKKLGNALLETVGGRAIHPINVRVGGFHRAPTPGELRSLLAPLRRARDDALATVEWVAGFEFPEFSHDHELLALDGAGRYPIDGGTAVITSSGAGFGVRDLDKHVLEEQVEHSTALRARLVDRGHYLTGPTARYALNRRWLSPLAIEAATRGGLGDTCTNPFRSIVVRAVELVYAVDEAIQLIERYRPPSPPHLAVPPRAGVGYGASEAPRGVLFHRYELDGDGIIRSARIIPPTSQNQAGIEDDLRRYVQEHQHLDDERLTWRCEQAIRNYDPCISCATHFLDLTVERT